MAREEFTADKLTSIAKELSDAAGVLASLSELMREENLPYALLHGTMAELTHIPAIVDWVGKANVDARTQIRAHKAGVPSRAELQKQNNERQKLAAAKKKKKSSG